MSISKFLIGPIKEGIRKDVKPYAIPEDAFDEMTNAYQWRGRVLRREGYNTLARLSTDGGTTFLGLPVMGLQTREEFGIGQQQLIAFDTEKAYSFNGTVFTTLASVMPVIWNGSDSQFFWTTNYANAFWATNGNGMPGLSGVNISNVVAGAGFTTITTSAPNGFSSGQTVIIINTGGTTDINGNSYVITVTGPSTFTIPYQTTGVYTTGGIALNSAVTQPGVDSIRYYGVLSNGTGWANYNPPIDLNTALAGALLIFGYKGYLVFLNTYEGNDSGTFNYPQRARWSRLGTPYYSPPQPEFPNVESIDITTMRSDFFGRGGFNDAPTNETIVAAGFIRDILVVFFERSTWRLRFVNNAQNPFVWERVNVELGSLCTFSSLPFDKGLMAIGNRGIVISDANDTIRFDEKIPDTIFNIRQANQGLQRVYGLRTFRSKLNYWTFPSDQNPNGIYPDQVLVFNYESKNWSFFDDCFTCFGYYYPATSQTWSTLTNEWSATSETWGGGQSELGYETPIAGNQQGYVLELRQEYEQGPNGKSLYISAINTGVSPALFTSPNHNLPDGTWITIFGTGLTTPDGVSIDGRNFKISTDINVDPNTFTLNQFETLTYPDAIDTVYSDTISWQGLIPGSLQINIGSIVFTDPNLNGILVGTGGVGGSGTIIYETGFFGLLFNSPILSTPVYVRIVSYDPTQEINIVNLIGSYTTGGELAKISGYDVQSKIFNFFKDDQRSRLSYIDFYTDRTTNGQFTTNVFADSSDYVANVPLPDNLQSNIVLTSANPYQISDGDQAIFRLFADVIAQTVQCQFTLVDQQLAVNAINSAQIGIISLIFALRRGGRLT